jgi:hypothetical protein
MHGLDVSGLLQTSNGTHRLRANAATFGPVWNVSHPHKAEVTQPVLLFS